MDPAQRAPRHSPCAGQVGISVENRGPGIPRHEWRRVFEPFYRGRRVVSQQVHGLDLGLALVKRIVEAHAGSGELESAPGPGCRLTSRIPVFQLREG